jgi:alanine racemase
MAVVKADAYGHGAPYASKELDATGADMFGVSNIEEAVQLRRCGITKPILILGYTPPESADELITHEFTQTVFSPEYAVKLSNAAQAVMGRIKVHIKLDTGMSRIGFLFNGREDAKCVDDVVAASDLPGLETEGVFTHFAVADEPENSFTKVQFERFMRAVGLIEGRGVRFKIKHCCNSAGLLNFPEMQLDMVRPGIILYGLTPAAGMPLPIKLEPAMELKTVIFQIKTLDPGTAVSYGMRYVTPSARVVGTMPIGYADGFARSLSNRADVLIGGKRAQIIGRVCMDQCLADITDIDGVCEDSVVTVIGRDGDEAVTMEETAGLMGTINYETACLIGKRVPRVFFKNGENIGMQNYILP